jgi:hypothetical protein
LPKESLFAEYLRRHPPSGDPRKLTEFFLRYDAGNKSSSEQNVSWFDLEERERAFLAPFVSRMEKHFSFLGWTQTALDARASVRPV